MGQQTTQDDERVAEFIALNSSDERLRLMCQWTARFYEAGKLVSIHVGDQQTAQRLDESMWTFSDMTFLPHAIAREASEPVLEPILIYAGNEQVDPADVLFEGSDGEALPNFGDFQYIFDFAPVYDEELRTAGRQRYSTYQQAGYKMRYVDR